jgi:hypothetical protein
MRFFAATVLTALTVGLASAIEFCPAADNLFYYGGNGNQYQVKCGIEYWTQKNLKSLKTNDPVACAA